jgi:DNA repair exonuclease SbcCD nuclease subunit
MAYYNIPTQDLSNPYNPSLLNKYLVDKLIADGPNEWTGPFFGVTKDNLPINYVVSDGIGDSIVTPDGIEYLLYPNAYYKINAEEAELRRSIKSDIFYQKQNEQIKNALERIKSLPKNKIWKRPGLKEELENTYKENKKRLTYLSKNINKLNSEIKKRQTEIEKRKKEEKEAKERVSRLSKREEQKLKQIEELKRKKEERERKKEDKMKQLFGKNHHYGYYYYGGYY